MANGCLEAHIHCVKPHYWAAMGHHWCWDISILRNASCRPRLLDDFVDDIRHPRYPVVPPAPGVERTRASLSTTSRIRAPLRQVTIVTGNRSDSM